jgi:hypothetical protein
MLPLSLGIFNPDSTVFTSRFSEISRFRLVYEPVQPLAGTEGDPQAILEGAATFDS